MLPILEKYKNIIEPLDTFSSLGKVSRIEGSLIESNGPFAKLHEICKIKTSNNCEILAEVIGFKENKIQLMPLETINSIGQNAEVFATGQSLQIPVSEELLGRVINGIGQVIDGKEIIEDQTLKTIFVPPPNALKRNLIEEKLHVGVRAIDGLLSMGVGQRMGIFAGSGIGKSTLLSMIARESEADINIIVVVGERGREVREFINRDLQEEGLKKSIVVVSTSDEPALTRVRSVFTATTLAEYFRERGKKVMLMVDSLTRVAHAQREIGASLREPLTTRGYTPSVFNVISSLVERAGNNEKGSITAFYTVLVEGNDIDEPISDAVRGMLDGHIMLSRKLASANHFPSIDITHSISRLMKDIENEEMLKLSNTIREWLAAYYENEELINIGAYAKGSNLLVDEAIKKIDNINSFLKQDFHEKLSHNDLKLEMSQIVYN